MKQHKKPDGDLLTQLIALILLAYLFFALFHALLTSGVLIITEKTTGDSAQPTYDLELNPAIFVFE